MYLGHNEVEQNSSSKIARFRSDPDRKHIQSLFLVNITKIKHCFLVKDFFQLFGLQKWL